jgi:hypothetical protein
MQRLETVEIDIDGNLGRINAKDFDPDIHTPWEEKAEEEKETVETKDEKESGEELTLAERVPAISTWAELQSFVEDNEIDFKAEKGDGTLKDKKTELLVALAEGEEE